MAIDTVAALADALAKNRLLEAAQFTEMARWQARFHDPRALARELLGRGWLTPYQINQLFQGNGRDLVLGSYILLERLGEGGMGQVFKARNQKLGRIVALKVIRKDRLSDEEAVQRFRREMKAVAQLSHPNVVTAIDADQTDDALFLVMEFVEGADLSRLVSECGPLPIDQACDYIRQAALGLDHAYERSLVHRDIKPSNLFLTGGTVKILDLGLARLQHPDGVETMALTQMGVVVGTPDYISPEQARNAHNADVRSDLYSLGCTFYFLLTGKPPFEGETATEKLLHHCFDEPTPIEQLRPDLPPRIANVVRKLMAKKPEDRYDAPSKLVTALSRPGVLSATWGRKPLWNYLRSALELPIRADAPKRLRKVAGRRRFKHLAFLGGGLLLVLLALSVIFLVAKGSSSPRKPTASSAALGRLPIDQLDAKSIPAEEHFAWQPKELVAVLGKHRGRSWGSVSFLAMSGDGQLIAAVGADGLPHLWEAATLRPRAILRDDASGNIVSLAFAPDSRTLACGAADGLIGLWDVGRPKPEKKALLRGHTGTVHALAFAPNGHTLASGSADDTVRLWETARPNETVTLRGHTGAILSLAFSPDGKSLASGSKDTSIRIWLVNGAASTSRFELTGDVGQVTSLAYSPKGDRLFSSSQGHGLRVWGANDGKLLNHQPDRVKGALPLGIISPDGRLLISTGGPNQAVRVWDLANTAAQERGPLAGQAAGLSALAFSTDGKRLVTAAADRLQIWDSSAAKMKLLSAADEGIDIHAVAMTSDGRTLAGGGFGGRLRLWDVGGAIPAETVAFDAHTRMISAVKFSADRKLLASGSQDSRLRLWDLANSKPSEVASVTFNQPVIGLAFATNGKTLAAASAERTAGVRLYTLGPGMMNLPGVPVVQYEAVSAMAMDGAGHTLVAALRDQSLLRLWDLSGRAPAAREPLRLPKQTTASALGISPDGRTIAAGTNAGVIKIWDEGSERGELTFPQARGQVHALAFSPKGDILAASYPDRLVIWELTTLHAQRTWEMPGAVSDLCFGPDGRHLITANSNGTVYIFRLAAPSFRVSP